MDMVEANKDWNARVVYGDTDSLFVELPGRSKSEAFRIGNVRTGLPVCGQGLVPSASRWDHDACARTQEIVEAVTNANPAPVKLKLEKVRRVPMPRVHECKVTLVRFALHIRRRCTCRAFCHRRSATLGSCTRAPTRQVPNACEGSCWRTRLTSCHVWLRVTGSPVTRL